MPDAIEAPRATPTNDKSTDHGSIVWIMPISRAAHEWHGRTVSVEQRCAGDLVYAIKAAGFDIFR